MKRALITGINGQDGSYLAEFLLLKGYEVFGFCRNKSLSASSNILSHASSVNLVFGDLENKAEIESAIIDSKPNEIYNLASQSSPSESWISPAHTLLVNGNAAVCLFDAARNFSPHAKIFHASSAEMFGMSSSPQSELTPFCPQNPYAASKVYAHQMAKIYRDAFGMYIANGILFNHESERRALRFLPQKVAYGAACAFLGLENSPHENELGRRIVSNGKLALGNLEVSRDWGYAPDFVEAMWLMLQRNKPRDYVIGTGILHSVQDLCSIAYSAVGLDWRVHVVSDPGLMRPADTGVILADISLAKVDLGWLPRTNFEEMVKKMVRSQIEALKKIKLSTEGV